MKKEIKPGRIEKGVTRGKPVEFLVDGQPVKAYQGETIAAALINAGIFISRTMDGNPMGVYCNIGVCHSCVMTVNGVANVRICQTLVSEGCRVESRHFQKGGWDEKPI
ncbi:MAG: (2Fe-2S)-binding protein [Thermodesulfobacteriota bacterium]